MGKIKPKYPTKAIFVCILNTIGIVSLTFYYKHNILGLVLLICILPGYFINFMEIIKYLIQNQK